MAPPKQRHQVWGLADHGALTLDSAVWAPKAATRDKQALTARLADQFLRLNRAPLADLGVEGHVEYDGALARLKLDASDVVGGVALQSPTSGMHELGMVVRPRFAWNGLGATWLETGWTVVPDIMSGHQLPESDRRTPLWVLSSVVLHRIHAMLRQIDRRFTMRDEVLAAPKGGVMWNRYASEYAPRAQFTSVPCRIPVLEQDHDLRGVIHYVLRRQQASLAGLRSESAVVLSLLDFCNAMLRAVADSSPRAPKPGELARWNGARTMSNIRPGLEAIEWTLEERGLAGLSDLRGLPWRLPMNEFFEAWVERVAKEVALRVGGQLRSGRRRETLSPLRWTPSFAGSQRYLLPDIVLESSDRVVVIDAKYKHHWRELSQKGWCGVEGDLRADHRADLLQVLAYSTLFHAQRLVCILAYPCEAETWDELERSGHLIQRAEVQGGSRNIEVFLTAVPFGRRPRDIASPLAKALLATE